MPLNVEPIRSGIVYRERALSPAQVTRELDELRYDMMQVAEALSVVVTVKNLVNKWGVAIITAAITAGLVNGTTAKFLTALVAAVHGG